MGNVQWHQLDHLQTICTSLQTDNHTNTSSLNLYTLDALPDAQPSSNIAKALRAHLLFSYNKAKDTSREASVLKPARSVHPF